MFHIILDFFFPRASLSGMEGEWITEKECRELAVFPIIQTKEDLRRRNILHIDRLVAAAEYEDSALLKKAIHTLKYGRVPALAEQLGGMIARAAPGINLLEQAVLCPVPLHWTRRFSRGFNQAELLAKAVSRHRGFPVHNLLRRARPTGHQAWRKREERWEALWGAFRVRGKDMPSFVILIDDLSTTGATLEECAGELKRAGVKRVEGWVIALG